MSIYDSLDFARTEVVKCMSCGNCQEVCPVYLEEKMEGAVARGKIKLVDALLKGKLDYSEGLAKKLDLCLTCKACNAKCPCGVQVDKIILTARAALVNKRGLHPLKKVIFSTMAHQSFFDLGLRAGSLSQGVFFKRHAHLAGFTPRFPMGLDKRRLIPPLAKQPFRSRVHEVVTVEQPRFKVALFTGCSGNYLYPEVAEGVLGILHHHGVEVVIPKEQHCCGLPILTHGDSAGAKLMAQSHVTLFSKLKVDYLITFCGSCGCSFKEHYATLLADKPFLAEQAETLAKKVMDWSTFILEVVGLDEAQMQPIKARVTYHEPCHLNRGLGVSAAPKEILAKIPQLELVPMDHADQCCGGAGSFSVTHYDLSMAIQEHKWANIQATKADYVATGCGSCMMQLQDGLNRFGGAQTICHTVELLSKSYGLITKIGQRE